jgi:hypothetical protein
MKKPKNYYPEAFEVMSDEAQKFFESKTQDEVSYINDSLIAIKSHETPDGKTDVRVVMGGTMQAQIELLMLWLKDDWNRMLVRTALLFSDENDD